MQSVYPGVEIHANLIAEYAESRDLLQRVCCNNRAYTQGAERGCVIDCRFSALSFLIAHTLAALGWCAKCCCYIHGTVGVNLYFWEQGFVLPLASQLLLTLSLILFHNAYGFFIEASWQTTAWPGVWSVRPARNCYAEMNKEGGDFGVGGESREMTVLFSDVVSFTSMSEKLEPDELTRLMNAYFTHMTEVIQQNRGTIDKYIGDAIMAFWGGASI